MSQYNCYNIVDDTICCLWETRITEYETSLCYLKDYWKENNLNDNDQWEEAIEFMKNGHIAYVDIPVFGFY